MRRSRHARLVVILAGLGVALPSAAAPDLPKTIGKLAPIERFALPNGLEVAVVRSDAPVASVQLWYHAGSKDEPSDRRGVAHMFEHLLFKGSERVRADAHTQSINLLGGFVNAATDEDATHYANTLPAEHVDYAIRLEADRMRGLLLRKPVIDSEREVIKGELRQQAGSPFAMGLLRCLSVAYTKHPYAWTASGDAKQLDATTAEDLKKYYDAYYQPNNALLVVVGNVPVAAVKASAEKWFGAIPKAAAPPRPSAAAVEPEATARRRQVVEPGQVGLTMVGWHVPAARHKDTYALQLASIVLGAGDGSRIKQRLKTPELRDPKDPKSRRALALEAGVDAILREEPGMLIALGAYLDPAQAEPVEAAILDEVAKLAARGPTADELRKAKHQIQSAFAFSLDTAQGLGQAIGRSWILTGDPSAFVRDADELERVSAAEVQRVVKQHLSADRAVIVVVPPKAR